VICVHWNYPAACRADGQRSFELHHHHDWTDFGQSHTPRRPFGQTILQAHGASRIFKIRNMASAAETLPNTQKLYRAKVFFFFGSIAAISLLVGGIGVDEHHAG